MDKRGAKAERGTTAPRGDGEETRRWDFDATVLMWTPLPSPGLP